MKKHLLLFGIMIIAALLLGSCSGDDDSTPTGPTNSAPGTPTLDAPSGAPTNGATGVSITPTMRWLCTDPDGDALKYTVSFGTATPPSAVSTDQTALSYSPSSLTYSTKYYWSITAKDPSGEKASSAIWNFTTMAEPAETVTTPDAPDGAATGEINISLNYLISGSTNSAGHAIEFSFDWGDGNISPWSSSTNGSHAWTDAGTYEVKLQARCQAHNEIKSDWSAVLSVTITVPTVETVSTPGTPTGAGSAEEGNSINFACAASTSSKGHQVLYRWDFGDGTISSWSSVRSRSYTWTTAGSYEVKAQARCGTHSDIVSEWSAAKSVTIVPRGAETVSAPNPPTAPATGTTNVNLVIRNEGGASSSDGDPLEYRFAYGDGVMSAWHYAWVTVQYKYATAGSYDISMQARCRTHTDIESAWSDARTIIISDPDESLSYNTKLVYGAVVNGEINQSYEYSVAHASITNLGDAMEGQYNWGDGTTSDWVQAADRTQSHAWTTEGTYYVTYTGRCTVHHDFTFTTATLVVTIVTEAIEEVSKPGYINWLPYERFPQLDTEILYPPYGGYSSLAHDIETRFSWGDGDTTGWLTTAEKAAKTWTTEGTFLMTRQSRCLEHPDVLSEWSNSTTIIPGPEKMNAPDAPDGPATGWMDQLVTFTASGGASTWHSTWIEHRIDWGDGTMSNWVKTTQLTLQHVYRSEGDFDVKAQARCIWPTDHTNPESEWSEATTITITILETIALKGNPMGHIAGAVGETYTFYTKYAAETNTGDAPEYRWDFGDGTISDWSLELSADHAFSTAGTYYVKYMARCSVHNDVMTGWSYIKVKIVVTSDPEAITPGNIYYISPSEINTGELVTFNFRMAESNWGDSVEYQVDFIGDGSVLSDWVESFWNLGGRYWEGLVKYTYTAFGSYSVRVRARCVAHPSVVSDWSAFKPVEVFEQLANFGAATGPSTGTVGDTLTFTTTGTTSDAGHALEYRWIYRKTHTNYYITEWSTSLTNDYVFTVAHNYYAVIVQARCIEHPDAVRSSSSTGWIVITE